MNLIEAIKTGKEFRLHDTMYKYEGQRILYKNLARDSWAVAAVSFLMLTTEDYELLIPDDTYWVRSITGYKFSVYYTNKKNPRLILTGEPAVYGVRAPWVQLESEPTVGSDLWAKMVRLLGHKVHKVGNIWQLEGCGYIEAMITMINTREVWRFGDKLYKYKSGNLVSQLPGELHWIVPADITVDMLTQKGWFKHESS